MGATLRVLGSRGNSVCIRCGTFKAEFQAKCPNCSFTPETDAEIAQSRALGPLYSFALGEDGGTVDTGRADAELQAISFQIRSGKPYEFPSEELAGVLAVYQAVQKDSPRQVWLTMAPLFIGALVVLGGLGYLIYAWPK